MIFLNDVINTCVTQTDVLQGVEEFALRAGGKTTLVVVAPLHFRIMDHRGRVNDASAPFGGQYYPVIVFLEKTAMVQMDGVHEAPADPIDDHVLTRSLQAEADVRILRVSFVKGDIELELHTSDGNVLQISCLHDFVNFGVINVAVKRAAGTRVLAIDVTVNQKHRFHNVFHVFCARSPHLNDAYWDAMN